MKWVITRRIEEALTQEGVELTIESSKKSDYITTSNGVIRVSDHDALTGRSACADVQINVSDAKVDDYDGKWFASLDYNDGLDFCEEVPFSSKEEAEAHNENCIIKEVMRIINK